MGVAIDSNVLVRYFTLDNDKLSPQAEQIIDGAEPSSLALDRIILAEVGYVLRSNYEFKKAEIGQVYLWLVNSPAFTVIDRELTELAVDLYIAETPLSFEDCCLLALRRSGRVSDVATFDVNLRKRLAE